MCTPSVKIIGLEGFRMLTAQEAGKKLEPYNFDGQSPHSICYPGSLSGRSASFSSRHTAMKSSSSRSPPATLTSGLNSQAVMSKNSTRSFPTQWLAESVLGKENASKALGCHSVVLWVSRQWHWPKPLLDQRRLYFLCTRIPPGIRVNKIWCLIQNSMSHSKVSDFVFRLPKFQEEYAYKAAARGMTIEFLSSGHKGITKDGWICYSVCLTYGQYLEGPHGSRFLKFRIPYRSNVWDSFGLGPYVIIILTRKIPQNVRTK